MIPLVLAAAVSLYSPPPLTPEEGAATVAATILCREDTVPPVVLRVIVDSVSLGLPAPPDVAMRILARLAAVRAAEVRGEGPWAVDQYCRAIWRTNAPWR